MDAKTAWTELTTLLREVEVIEGIGGVLSWDQQTMMPPSAGALRGEQIALLSRMAHEKLAHDRTGELLDAVEAGGDLDEVKQATVRNVRRSWDRAVRVDPALVHRLAQAQAAGFAAWMKARQAEDFGLFAPALEELVALTTEKARSIGGDRPIYDVLLEDFDPGTTIAELRGTFGRLRDGLTELIDAVREVEAPRRIPGTWPVDAQRALHMEVLEALGYDMQAGRLDDAEHPFTVGIGTGDVRITTHLYTDDLLGGLGGTVHECGHALYEQGLPPELRGTTCASAASFGLHESQSRFWENFVGRSLPFFRWFVPKLKRHFPAAEVTPELLYSAANRVEPGFVRVVADEVTYNLHIIVRFELEVALFEGRLAVRDLPQAWNDRYQEYLGLRPRVPSKGVLQDVHWSGGAFAYFPSYTLGNLYAAALGATLEQQTPDLWDEVERGQFGFVLDWLRENVHRKGHLKEAPEIVREVVGERDMVEDLLAYLWNRHGATYGVQRPRG